jgi:hypothetical protein
MATDYHPRIAVDPAMLLGKPIIRGTRLSVEFLIGLMADGGVKPISWRIIRGSPRTTSWRAYSMRAMR